MTKDECAKLIDELYELAKEGPDASRKPWALPRVHAIAAELHGAASNTYVKEKINDMVTWFEIWYSPRRWQKWGASRCSSIVHGSIYTLRSAMHTSGGLITQPQDNPA